MELARLYTAALSRQTAEAAGLQTSREDLAQLKLASLWRTRMRGLSGLSSPRMSHTAAPLEKILSVEIATDAVMA
jgi:hypothetical protein